MGGDKLVKPEIKPLAGTQTELSALLKQLQQSVLDDRKALIQRVAGEDGGDGEHDGMSDIIEESTAKDHKQRAVGDARGVAPAQRSKASVLSLPISNGGVQARIQEEATKMLGVPALFNQIEALFVELENTPDAEEMAPFSPLRDSPKKSISLFAAKKGEKKRLIEEYRAQLKTLDAERHGILERSRKSGETGAVALGMLREEWVTAQTELDSKCRELENAYELITRQEEEVNKMKGRLNGLKKQVEELKARPPTVIIKEVPASPQQIKTEELAFVQPATRKSETNDGAASEARLEQLESELDLAYGKIEALSFQQHTSQDRSAVMFRQLQDELRDVKAQLVTKAKKYAQLKDEMRHMEEELEAAGGQNEAVKHQLELRYAKLEDRLKEAMREALENEKTAKSALFKREQAEAEAQRLREQYDILVGQFEAIRSQVELEKLEASGIVARYEKELEDVYGRLDAKDEYAGLLSGVKKDMDTEMTELWEKVENAEASRVKMESAFVSLGEKYRNASARRIFNFVGVQRKRMLREAFAILKDPSIEEEDDK